MKRFLLFLKKDIVMCISFILALISIFFVRPSASYLSYIDFRTLSLLLCLMLVMAGLRNLGLFHQLGQALLKTCHTTRQMALVLICLCFFSSMLITNDVALITFVPFTLEILALSEEHKLAVPIIALQTIAANLGSMLTPLGNPQNLYLYSLSGISLPSFLLLLLPYTMASFLGILIVILTIPKKSIVNTHTESAKDIFTQHTGKMLLYTILFLLCLTCVLRVLPYPILLFIVILSILLADRKNLLRADYALLLTFTFLFIFIGNLSHIDFINEKLAGILQGHELGMGILASQIISNVPAAILLSGFTTNYHSLLLGVNIGGLGTLIASMASLISFKQFSFAYKNEKSRYMIYFTVLNIIFLVFLYTIASLLSRITLS